MEDDDTEIEFLESQPDPDAPPLGVGPAWRRPAAFVLVLGLSVAATAAVGVHTYRRDRAADRAAATLVLREQAIGDPVSLPNTAAPLGGPGAWTSDPSTTVEVDVVNLSPDAVTLLPSATLRGPGVTPAALRPEGDPRLSPGQVGRLVGTVRADCTLPGTAPTDPDGQTTLLVRARLADGSVGTAPIGLNTGGESVREQICLHQGATVVSGDFAASADPARGTFTVRLTARSLGGGPLSYTLRYQYTDVTNGSALQAVPDATLGKPAASGSITGVLPPGGRLSGGFTVPVARCPVTLPEENVDVELQLVVDDAGRRVLLRADRFDLSLLVAAACGQFG